jgi:hypothetical protein
MAGVIGSVPYGVVGSVSALAMGANPIVAPIAAAANHGAIRFVVVFTGLLLAGSPYSGTSIVALAKTAVVVADIHSGFVASRSSVRSSKSSRSLV